VLLLTATDQTLELETSGAFSTDWTTHYADHTSTTFTPGANQGNVATATTTTIVAAPAASTQRQIKSITVRNRDAVSTQTVIIKKDVAATEFQITGPIQLAPGELLVYVDGEGWTVYDINGARKINSTGGGSGITNINLSAGTTSQNLSRFVLSDSNNVSFGLNGSTVTASASFAPETPFGVSAGTQSVSTGTLVFSDSNGVSFGMSGSSRVTASVATSLTNINLSAGTTSQNLSAFVLSNSNGISFGLNGSTVTGSHNAITSESNQQMTMFATGNTTQSSSGTSNASSLIFRGEGVASIGITDGSVVVSVPSGGGGLTNINLSAGTTSQNLSAFVLSNSNNVSFGLNGSTVTGSASFAPETPFGISAGTQSVSTGTLVFSNSNGVSFGMSGSSRVTASVASSLTAINLSAGTTSNNASAFTLANANGVSFGLDASTITGSVAAGATATGNLGAIAAGTQTATSGTVVFSDSNGLSFGLSGSTRVTASFAAIKSVSAGTTRVTDGEVVFSNSNGVTFGVDGQTVTASIAPGAAAGIGAIAGGTQTATSGTIVFSDSNNVSFGLSGSTRMTASIPVNSLVFSNQNGVTFGTSTDGSTTTVTASVATSLTNINVSAGTTSNNLSAVVFSNSNGVSFGLNGSTVTGSVAAGGGGGATLSYYEPYMDRLFVVGQQGQGTLHLNHLPFVEAVQFDRIGLMIHNTNSSNSSGSHTLSFWAGLYTKNASTLSLLLSASQTTALTHSGTVGSYSLYSGLRLFTIGATTTLTAGDYWMGILSRTTSGGANGTYSQLLASAMGSNFVGHFGSSHNTTYQVPALGRGIYTATTSSMPNSIGFSQIRGSDSIAFRPPVVVFCDGTI
jgi:hypothetical protein